MVALGARFLLLPLGSFVSLSNPLVVRGFIATPFGQLFLCVMLINGQVGQKGTIHYTARHATLVFVCIGMRDAIVKEDSTASWY